ncbi:MAG: aminoglycoside phosphotransferase family protein [Candidatus Izemoplasmatales bacterium]|jgi:thiamine kinase-like enzyme|nr:aminoglycoside phosphotransferase family protein [Candidatus Izemoplasmatales bacterium]
MDCHTIINNVVFNLLGENYEIVKQFQDSRLHKKYNVFLVKFNNKHYVVKKSNSRETLIANKYLANHDFKTLKVLNEYTDQDGNCWILYNYIDLKDARHRNIHVMRQCGNAIAEIHAFYLKKNTSEDLDTERTVRYYRKKSESLQNYPLLYAAASIAIQRVNSAPITLCHEDLLPINILCDENQAVIIDFEEAYFLAYFLDPARFVTHYDYNNTHYISKSSQAIFLSTYYQCIKKVCTDLSKKQYYYDLTCGRFLEAMIVFVNMTDDTNKITYNLYLNDLNQYANCILSRNDNQE